MKKGILSIVLMTASLVGSAQNTDTFRKFDVGPFEVVDEDNNYRLRDGVNIPEYFGLKKQMGKNSVQADLFLGMRGDVDVNTYGIDLLWKKRISGSWFLNIGVTAAVPSAKSNKFVDEKSIGTKTVKDTMSLSVKSCYLGVPITLECVWGKNSLVSGYFGFGVTPGICFIGALGVENEKFNKSENYADRSLFLAPRVDLGIYAPAGKHYVRAGILLEYKIPIAGESKVKDMFKCGIGSLMPGVSLGMVF